jgi:segregation and condensation protein B
VAPEHLVEPAQEELPAQEVSESEASETTDDTGAGSGDAASTLVEDEKRAARLRDREIRDEVRRIVDQLIAEYEEQDRGMEIREIAGGYRVATKPEYHDAVRAFVKSLKPPMKLSLQALETLAVIAYKQPVTAPEVGDIRGVDSAGVLGSLISRKLITTAGRKQVIGRPILYKTTKEFLLRFGLKDLSELPSMEEFEKMADELAENEPAEPGELPFAQNGIADIEGIDDDPDEVEVIHAARAAVAVGGESDLEDEADIPAVAAVPTEVPADADGAGDDTGHDEAGKPDEGEG